MIMKWIALLICLIYANTGFSQWKNYIIGAKGDTLNRVDQNNLKQGRWFAHVDPLRGEPGYEEEGVYKDGKKDGTWRRFSLMGDLLAVENYRFGNKNGTCTYFTIAGMIREESWKSIDPKNPYDTIQVPDLHDDTKVYTRVIRVDASVVKHGTWNYYDPSSGALIKSETYVLDKLQEPSKKVTVIDAGGNTTAASGADSTAAASDKKAKPAAVAEYEKKNSGKKKIKVRDGSTGY